MLSRGIPVDVRVGAYIGSVTGHLEPIEKRWGVFVLALPHWNKRRALGDTMSWASTQRETLAEVQNGDLHLSIRLDTAGH